MSVLYLMVFIHHKCLHMHMMHGLNTQLEVTFHTVGYGGYIIYTGKLHIGSVIVYV